MQVASSLFHNIASGEVIPLDWAFRVAFLKEKRDNLQWFTLNQSSLNGSALLSTQDDNPLQLWDSYKYDNYDSRIISMNWERSLEFPYFVQSALADISVDNHDDYFTPQGESPIGEYLIPKRPIRLYAGYGGGAGVLPQFVGLTHDMPEVDDGQHTVSFHAMDFLSEIFEMPLNETVAMRNVTTDVVLKSIMKQFGLLESQFNFDVGANLIPFLFFEKNTKAGDAIRKLMQAEMGRLWLDEQGIMRFNKRVAYETNPVMVLSDSNIIKISSTGRNDMFNHVKITTPVREVQEFQTIHKKDSSGNSTSNLWVVTPDSSITISLDLEDPCYSVTAPTLGYASSVSWFTAKTSNGTPVTSLITASGELRTNSYEVTFTNNNLFAIEIDELELWGEPAKQVDLLDYEAFSDDWNKDNDSLLEIQDNDFLQNYDNARSFALNLFDGYAHHHPIIEMEIKGNLALQLDDIIEVSHKYIGQYRINSISTNLSNGGLSMTIKARKHMPKTWFTLDESALDGPDLLAY